MPLEVIERVTRVEAESKERRTAAEAQAKQMIADAQRNGLALLQQVRRDAAAREKELLRQAEEPGRCPCPGDRTRRSGRRRCAAPESGGTSGRGRRAHCQKGRERLIWPL